jgi:hypothetical protein
MTYSPLVNSGLPELNSTMTNNPVAPIEAQMSLYSPKKVVSSSLPVRQQASQIGTMADDLAQKLDQFEKNSANDVVLNNLKMR